MKLVPFRGSDRLELQLPRAATESNQLEVQRTMATVCKCNKPRDPLNLILCEALRTVASDS